VVLAADYPFLNIFWTMILFFSWVIWIWAVVAILTDVFRRRDIGGWAKAGWMVALIVLPFVGALIYLVTQHDSMAERSANQMQEQQAVIDDRIRAVATADGPSAEIANAKRLLDQGAIDQTEFTQLKRQALAKAA
jgi:phospholipase D-like protein